MATLKKTAVPLQSKTTAQELVPSAPEVIGTTVKKRKRLAKAFKRPLDKTFKSAQVVREKFAMPEGEFDQLLELKQRLSEQGMTVKKSELVRAGLLLLAALDDSNLKATLAKIVPAVG